MLLSAAVGAFVLFLADEDGRFILAPALCAVIASLFLWVALWDRDGKLPLFDAGALCGTVTSLYTAIPLLQYYASGMTFTILSDNRLFQHSPTPSEMGLFSIRFVVYLVFFVCTYVLFRGSKAPIEETLDDPGKTTRVITTVLFASLFGFFFLLQSLFGVRYATSYDDLHESLLVLQSLPLLVQQVFHYLQGMLFIFKLGLLTLVVQRYRVHFWRIVLYGWMATEVLLTVLLMGARTEMALTLLAVALLYHRLVRPISMKVLLPAGIALFIGFTLFGFLRSSSLEYLQSEVPDDTSILSAANEFDGAFSTAYDIHQMKQYGGLSVPWQVYASDFLALVPQQLLPFEKLDPSQWYLHLLGLRGTGVGLMFGVVAQGIVGFDWIELAFRGAILGYILALVHGWYVRNSSNYFVSLFYLWLCLTMYTTTRGTTFTPVVHIAYEFLPAYLLMRYLPVFALRNTR
jgi:hypothetical protein